MICKIYSRKSFRRHFSDVFVRASFLSASFRERRTEGRRTKKLQDPETPSDSQFASNSPFTSGGPGSRRLCYEGKKGEETGVGGGKGGRKGTIKLPGKNLTRGRELIFPETNVTDRSNLHLTGSAGWCQFRRIIALLSSFPFFSSFSLQPFSETYIVPQRFSNAILLHAPLLCSLFSCV